MTRTEILLAIVAGLAVNELSDLSPWLARKIVRWAAYRRYEDHSRAQVRAEEWAALVADRPGKLLKVFTALGLAAAGVVVAAKRRSGLLAAMPAKLRLLLGGLTVATAVAGWWWFMLVQEIALPEAYTLPLAAMLLLAGSVAMRRRSGLGSWIAYGPALLVGLGPSLVIVFVTESVPARLLLLLAAALGAFGFGLVRRFKAPAVGGITVAALVMFHAASLLLDVFVAGAAGVVLILGLTIWSVRRRRMATRTLRALEALGHENETGHEA